MSLSLALNTALTGLQVNQRTMASISNNIANANTEGYSRQLVDLESVNFDGVGAGVRIEDVVRKVDEYLQVSIYNQGSALGQSEAINNYYDQMQILFGDPSLGNSIDDHVENFFNDLQQMAETPERNATRVATVQSALTLTREISNLALGLEQLRFQADGELNNDVGILNQRLEELFFTNEAIAEASAFGNPIASLLDERDLLAEEISQYIDIRVNDKENGTIDVYAGNGLNLINFGYSRIEYREIGSVESLIADGNINPLVLQGLDENGQPQGLPINIASGGTSSQIETRFDEGKLSGLLNVRDQIIPDMLAQLDQLASQLRDAFNAVHNQGSGYPPATEMLGTVAYDVAERSFWEGSVTIAALNEDGTPASSAFNDEVSGFRPLNLQFSELLDSQAPGEIDVQTIIDEINHHFGVPQNRMQVGNLNNVELALISNEVPGTTPIIEFDFDIENISGENADFWIDGIQVLDDTAADITSTTNTIPTVALSAVSTFVTAPASNVVTVSSALNHGLSDGDMVRLSDPGIAIDGIPAAEFDGYFVVSNVTANTFDITVVTPAAGGPPTDVAGQVFSPPYDTIIAGEQARLQQNGTISADLSGNPTSAYYDINVDIVTRDESGNLSTTTATYRVLSNKTDTQNDRIAARAVTAGSGIVDTPDTLQPLLRASLVDENGVALSNTNNNYGDQRGFLKIESIRDGLTFAIDDTSSIHRGLPSDTPPREGTNRGFSHHFGLNNFFTNNETTPTGDTVKGSAINLTLESRFVDNAGLIASGNLQLSNQPVAGTSLDPLYTRELYSGDHSVAQRLARLGIDTHSFTGVSGLPDATLTFNAYAGEFLGKVAADSISAERNSENDEILLQGYAERADAVSGVNLDEELANTIIYQNAYSASARVISITDELFETLLNSF